MTALEQAVMDLLEVAYEQTTDELVHTLVSRPSQEPPTAQQIINAIDSLVKARWIYSPTRQPGHSATWRRRTEGQRDALMAEINPKQGTLL